MKYYIIVDYPNLICRIIELEIPRASIVERLSLNVLLNHVVKPVIRKEFGAVQTIGIEIFCSEKLPGPKAKKLTREQNQRTEPEDP